VDAQKAQIWTASVVIGIELKSAHKADLAWRDDRGAVTVGNEAPVWQGR